MSYLRMISQWCSYWNNCIGHWHHRNVSIRLFMLHFDKNKLVDLQMIHLIFILLGEVCFFSLSLSDTWNVSQLFRYRTISSMEFTIFYERMYINVGKTVSRRNEDKTNIMGRFFFSLENEYFWQMINRKSFSQSCS